MTTCRVFDLSKVLCPDFIKSNIPYVCRTDGENVPGELTGEGIAQ